MHRQFYIINRAVQYFLILLIISLSPRVSYGVDSNFIKDFKEVMSEPPKWWDQIEASNDKITTYEELLKYWQSGKHYGARSEIETTERECFKTIYFAILNNSQNDDIVFTGLSLMNRDYADYSKMLELQELGVKYFFDYNKRVDRCANCMLGDGIARHIYFMNHLYAKSGRQNDSIKNIERVFKERGDEISQYHQAELYGILARSYWEIEKWDKAIEVLEQAIGKWERRTLTRALGREVNYLNRMLKGYKKEIQIEQQESNKTKGQGAKFQIKKSPKGKAEQTIENLLELIVQNKMIFFFVIFGLLMLSIIREKSRSQKKRKLIFRSLGLSPDKRIYSKGEIETMIKAGLKLDAIIAYNRLTQVGLKRSKQAIEKAEREGGLGYLG